MKNYMTTCWIVVFALGAIAMAYAPYADPYGYVQSTLEIEYQAAKLQATEANFQAQIAEIVTHHQARRDLDREWQIIPQEYREYIRDMNLGMSPGLIYAVVYYESWWYPQAVGYNRNGTMDLGLMQLNNRYMYHFARIYYTGEEPFDPLNPRHNLEVGLKHFKSLIQYYQGDLSYALAAYNAGRGRVNSGRIPTSTIHYRERILHRATLVV